MADMIQLQPHTLPWLPGESEVAPVTEFHRYDFPLAGVITQHGVFYLFQCLWGETSNVSIWLYSIVEPSEVAELEATSNDDLPNRVWETGTSRPGRMAIAIEDLGIVSFADVSVWVEAEVRPAVGSLFEGLNGWLDSLRRNSDSAAAGAQQALVG